METPDPVAARLPPPVRAGDRVGVAALSGPVDPSRLARGLAALSRLGFQPVLASNVEANLQAHRGLLAGSDAERLAAFHDLAADPSLTAIFFARGGHGVLRILGQIDWSLLASRPRAYVGYSDLTPFLLEVVRRLSLVAFHGPMVATDLDRGLGQKEAASLIRNLSGEFPMSLPLTPMSSRAGGEGPLLGGCLSLLVATLGTPFFPDLRGALLFLEDVNEPLFRLDRMLTHLKLSGNLTDIGGMLLGHFGGGAESDEEEKVPGGWLELITDGVREYPWSVAYGLSSGHGIPNLTLPLGCQACLERGASSLILNKRS